MNPPSTLHQAVLISLLASPALLAQAGGFAAQTVITTAADRPTDVYATDLDGDGDMDVLSSSSSDDKIAWHENLGAGVFGPQQIISTAANQPTSVYAMDLDGDGDADVLSASIDDKIAWYENMGGGVFGAQQVISTAALDPGSVFAIDLDGDGDADVLSASISDDKIAWYENMGGGIFGPQQVITTAAMAASDVYAKDLDGDSDADVLSVSIADDKLAWYENLGGGVFGPQQVISTGSTFFTSVHATDLDADGDADVLTASRDDHEIAWYENLGAGVFGSQQIISTEIAGSRSVYAADFDGDGDVDVVAIGSGSFNPLGWFENLGGGAFGPLQPIVIGNSPLLVFGQAVFAADLDGDGTADVLTASKGDDKVSWYANWSTVTTFGAGCGSASLVFAPSSTAVINTPMAGRIVHSQTTLCVVALGLSKTNMPGLGALPFDLSAIGMNGCMLYQSSEVFGLATQPSSVPFNRIDWTGPALPAGALGLHLYAQAICFAPSANPLGVISSNAIDWTISQ